MRVRRERTPVPPQVIEASERQQSERPHVVSRRHGCKQGHHGGSMWKQQLSQQQQSRMVTAYQHTHTAHKADNISAGNQESCTASSHAESMQYPAAARHCSAAAAWVVTVGWAACRARQAHAAGSRAGSQIWTVTWRQFHTPVWRCPRPGQATPRQVLLRAGPGPLHSCRCRCLAPQPATAPSTGGTAAAGGQRVQVRRAKGLIGHWGS